MSKETRRRRRQSTATPSQEVINRRIREVWIDGYGLMPGGLTQLQIDRTREALRVLVADGKYWDGLKQLGSLKMQVEALMECIRNPVRKAKP